MFACRFASLAGAVQKIPFVAHVDSLETEDGGREKKRVETGVREGGRGPGDRRQVLGEDRQGTRPAKYLAAAGGATLRQRTPTSGGPDGQDERKRAAYRSQQGIPVSKTYGGAAWSDAKGGGRWGVTRRWQVEKVAGGILRPLRRGGVGPIGGDNLEKSAPGSLSRVGWTVPTAPAGTSSVWCKAACSPL